MVGVGVGASIPSARMVWKVLRPKQQEGGGHTELGGGVPGRENSGARASSMTGQSPYGQEG